MGYIFKLVFTVMCAVVVTYCVLYVAGWLFLLAMFKLFA